MKKKIINLVRKKKLVKKQDMSTRGRLGERQNSCFVYVDCVLGDIMLSELLLMMVEYAVPSFDGIPVASKLNLRGCDALFLRRILNYDGNILFVYGGGQGFNVRDPFTLESVEQPAYPVEFKNFSLERTSIMELVDDVVWFAWGDYQSDESSGIHRFVLGDTSLLPMFVKEPARISQMLRCSLTDTVWVRYSSNQSDWRFTVHVLSTTTGVSLFHISPSNNQCQMIYDKENSSVWMIDYTGQISRHDEKTGASMDVANTQIRLQGLLSNEQEKSKEKEKEKGFVISSGIIETELWIMDHTYSIHIFDSKNGEWIMSRNSSVGRDFESVKALNHLPEMIQIQNLVYTFIQHSDSYQRSFPSMNTYK